MTVHPTTTNQVMQPASLGSHYVERLGLALVPAPKGSKAPVENGWQTHPIRTAQEAQRVEAAGGNLGLHHAESGTGMLDIDHGEYARLALASVGIDLEELLAAQGAKVQTQKGLMPMYRMPPGVKLSRRSLSWKTPKGNSISVFELRGGLVQDLLPPSIHPSGMSYTWQGGEVPQNRDDIPVLQGSLLTLWQNWDSLKPILEKASPWAPPPPARTYQVEGTSVIAAYNEAHSVREELEARGYIAKSSDRYLSPHSSTGVAGVMILKGENGLERVYSHHGSDPFADGHVHDAFSLFCTFEHNTDIKAAVKAAAAALGMTAKAAELVEVKEEPEEPWLPKEALPALRPDVPTLSPELLPEPLRPWLQDTAERTSLPLELVACPAIVGLSSVIGRSLGIRPKQFDNWLVVPNLWGGTIGRPGVMKTTANAEGTKPVAALATKARDAYKAQAAKVEAQKAQFELEMSALKDKAKSDARKSSISSTFQEDLTALATQLANASVTERRYITQDATTEKLGELLQENPRGMLLLRDELAGWLRTLERAGREGEREFYLEAWNGTGSYTFDRIGRGTVHIEALTLSIFGAIQPGKLERYLQEAMEGGGGADGLLQRFQLIVWPDIVGQYVQVDRYPDSDARRKANAIFEKLDTLDLAALGLDAQEDEIPALHFASDAQALFDEWRTQLEYRLREKDLATTPAFESHLSKYRSLMPSLALIFHLVSMADGTASGPVSLKAAQLAAAWCEYLELHARKLYAQELNGHLHAAHLIAKRLKQGDMTDEMSVRDLYRRGWEGLSDPETVESGLTVLKQVGWVRVEERKTPGRSTQVLRLHPDFRGDA